MPSLEEDYYQILDLKSSANKEDIENAWKGKRVKYHPDKAPDGRKAEYTAKFQALQTAYNTLINTTLRFAYDEKKRSHASTDKSSRSASPAANYNSARPNNPTPTVRRAGSLPIQKVSSQERPRSSNHAKPGSPIPLQPSTVGRRNLALRPRSSTTMSPNSTAGDTSAVAAVNEDANQATFASIEEYFRVVPGYSMQSGFKLAHSPRPGIFHSQMQAPLQMARIEIDNTAPVTPSDINKRRRPRSRSDSPRIYDRSDTPPSGTRTSSQHPGFRHSPTPADLPTGARRYYPLHDNEHLYMLLPGVTAEIRHSLSLNDQSFLRLTYLAYKHGVDIVQYPFKSRTAIGYSVEWSKYGLVEVVLQSPPTSPTT